MIERLADLASTRARVVLIVAAVFFVAAAVLGSGVADRLDPYSADDPATESVIAEQQLQRAGYRETGVVVLVEGVDPSSAAGRERVEALTARDRRRPRRRLDRDYRSTGSDAFVSRDGDATYLAVALSRPRRRPPGRRRADRRLARGRARGHRRAAARWPRRRSTSRSNPTCAGPSCSPSRSCSCSRCSSSAAWSRRCCRSWSAAWRSSARC